MILVSTLLLPLVVAASGPAVLAESAAPVVAKANVSITLIVGRQGGAAGTGEKSYRVLGQEGSKMSMLMGWRTPIPTRSSGENGAASPTMSYVYQNVGVSGTFETQALGGGRYLVNGQVEISGAQEAPAATAPGGTPPLIGTFQQELRVVVTKGQKLRVAEAPGPEGGMLYLDLRLDLLD